MLSFGARPKNSWPKQAAVVISDAPNMYMILKELLRNYNWRVVTTTSIVQDAMTAVFSGEAFLAVIDDSNETPAFSIIRQLMASPFTCAIPTLAFSSDQNVLEQTALARMNQPEIVEKPLTPAKFVPKFQSLIKLWETTPYFLLRQSVYQLLTNNEEHGLKILTVLAEKESEVKHMAVQVLATYLFRVKHDPKAAEKLLLASLKQSSKNLANIMTLGDIYLCSSMPKLAQRLFLSAKNTLPNSQSIFPDIAQASIVLGEMDMAIEHLMTMYNKNFMPATALSFLSRIMVAEGKEDHAETTFGIKRSVLTKIQKSWDDSDDISVERTAS